MAKMRTMMRVINDATNLDGWDKDILTDYQILQAKFDGVYNKEDVIRMKRLYKKTLANKDSASDFFESTGIKVGSIITGLDATVYSVTTNLAIMEVIAIDRINRIKVIVLKHGLGCEVLAPMYHVDPKYFKVLDITKEEVLNGNEV